MTDRQHVNVDRKEQYPHPNVPSPSPRHIQSSPHPIPHNIPPQSPSSGEWNINGALLFDMKAARNNEPFESESFNQLGAIWKLQFYPNGHERHDMGFCSIFLHCVSILDPPNEEQTSTEDNEDNEEEENPKEIHVKYKITIKSIDREQSQIILFEQEGQNKFEEGDFDGWNKSITNTMLQQRIDKELIISYKLIEILTHRLQSRWILAR